VRTGVKLDVNGPAGRRAHGEQLADKVRGGDDVEFHGERLESQHLGGTKGGDAQWGGALANGWQAKTLAGLDESDKVGQDGRLHLLELRGVGMSGAERRNRGAQCVQRTLQAMRKHTRGR
jgi:hypothetical protein